MDNQAKPHKTRRTGPTKKMMAELRKFRASQASFEQAEARLDQMEINLEKMEAVLEIKPPKFDIAAPANALHTDDLRDQMRALSARVQWRETRLPWLKARQLELTAALDTLMRAISSSSPDQLQLARAMAVLALAREDSKAAPDAITSS